MRFRLAAVRKGLEVRGKEKRLVFIKARYEALPEEPHYMPNITGDYGTVSKQAVKLNQDQEKAGFIDWLFAPEVIKEEEGK